MTRLLLCGWLQLSCSLFQVYISCFQSQHFFFYFLIQLNHVITLYIIQMITLVSSFFSGHIRYCILSLLHSLSLSPPP